MSETSLSSSGAPVLVLGEATILRLHSFIPNPHDRTGVRELTGGATLFSNVFFVGQSRFQLTQSVAVPGVKTADEVGIRVSVEPAEDGTLVASGYKSGVRLTPEQVEAKLEAILRELPAHKEP